MECRNVKNGDLLKVMVNDHGRGNWWDAESTQESSTEVKFK